MRSRPFKKVPVAERLAERRGGVMLGPHAPDRSVCYFDGRHLWTGTDTKHRTPGARKWRCRVRIKRLVRGGVAQPCRTD